MSGTGGIVVKLAVLTVLATAFYMYVGQLVPQSEVHPPEVVEVAQDVTPEELAEIGRDVFYGRGMCTDCHTIGQTGMLRFPDLANIAVTAGRRVPGMSALEYLGQSLYDPDAFIVPGFAGGMPAVDRPPVSLTPDEIRAVLAFLQTLGGEATITMETPIPFAPGAPAPPREEPVAVAEIPLDPPPGVPAPTRPQARPAPVLLQAYGCASCHQARDVSLAEVGRRLSREEILTALAIHERMPGGPELVAAGYYDEVTLAEARSLAEHLARGGGGP
jgi:mono/diheme cytochrome c family protein